MNSKSLPQPVYSVSYNTRDPMLYMYGKNTSSYITSGVLRLVEGFTTTFLVVFLLVTGLRLYARTRLLESGFRLDDGRMTYPMHVSVSDNDHDLGVCRSSCCISGTPILFVAMRSKEHE